MPLHPATAAATRIKAARKLAFPFCSDLSLGPPLSPALRKIKPPGFRHHLGSPGG
jgi:hypothetical protein